MATREEKVACRTPTPGKKPTRIARRKFDAIRSAILKVLPKTGEGVPFADLTRLVDTKLSPDIRSEIGSLMWYVTSVKLELEVRGEIRRVPDVSPQRLLRTH